jgi:CDP-paratose 2-epimerase
MGFQRGYILITGGAGFIGTNVARAYLQQSRPVYIFDNLSRPGVEENVEELQHHFPGRVCFANADVGDAKEIRKAVQSASAVYHFAAQVAVTTSLDNPIRDFQTNVVGTLNLLDAIRTSTNQPPLLFTSTNKVYGKLGTVSFRATPTRWEPEVTSLAANGISEQQSLEFLSPYGCSKGAADQYVLDYAHSYGIRATVFRMSCIYGRYQLGSEDQGWVAHFVRQAMKNKPITIYGDGKQVRDLLFVDDLVRAMQLAQENMDIAAGEPFNLGGGPANSASLFEVVDEIQHLTGNRVEIEWGPERLGDQKWYVADTGKIRKALGWFPAVSVREGIRTLYEWYLERPGLVEQAKVMVA